MTRASMPSNTEGLYDGRYEHDACGVGFVADLSGRRSYNTVARALSVLRNLEHRGAKGSEPDTGDGAGIVTQIPDSFFREVAPFALPEPGTYAVGTAFLARSAAERTVAIETIERRAADENLTVLGWREVPHEPSFCGGAARAMMPHLVQLFVAGNAAGSAARSEEHTSELQSR